MENQIEESASTQQNQRLDSLSYELRPASSRQEIQKRNRWESPPQEVSHTPPQHPKRSRIVNPSPLSFQPLFPQDIIVEIFSNMPVGSLVRFRCLSKSWKSLITDPFFIKKHLDKSQNDPEFTKNHIFFYTWNVEYKTSIIRSCSVSAIFKDPFINSVEVVDPTKTAYRVDWIVGSCNGLICIDTRHCIDTRQGALFLLNPTLRACKRLPNLGFKERKGCYTVYGFGFDASADDYKVVRIFSHREDGYESIVRVYSLRTNCWRRIQNFAFGAPCDQPGKYVDGSLNWTISRRQETGFLWIIVSLDLAQETYKEVPQPAYRHGANDKTLGVLNGCLCVLCDYEGSHIDVWVMREYGKRESWTKLLTMPHIPDPGAVFISGITPLYVSENEIMLLYGVKVFLYDLKERTFRTPAIHNDPVSYIYQAGSCMESLVSPTIANQQ